MANFSPSDDAYSIKQASAGSTVTEKLESARDNTNVNSMNASNMGSAIQFLEIIARPQANVNFYVIYRSHLIFDLSGADAGTIESATLKLYAYEADTGGTRNNGHKFYVIGHDYGGTLNAALDDVNPTNYAAGDWTSTDVPTYSSEITVNGVSAGDLISVTLNSAAITDINSALASGDFDIGLVTNYDYKDDFTLTPSITTNEYNGVRVASQDHATSAYRPVLELNYASPTTGPFKIQAGARVQVSSGKFKVGTI